VNNLKICVYCAEDLDISKSSYIHSPIADEYRHLSCYNYSMMFRVKEGISRGLRAYQEDKESQKELAKLDIDDVE